MEPMKNMGMNIPPLMADQHRWLNKTLEPFLDKLVYVGYHGSHLYGLDHSGSDIDVKAVYLPSKEDLILGNSLKTHNKKNDDLGIEIEIKSLSSFLKSAGSCDTNCVDLLHTPDQAIIFKSTLWMELREHRSGLYAKNMKGIIGYIKTHAKKYTNKIDRLLEMNLLLELCESNLECKTISELCDKVDISKYKYIDKVTLVADHEQQYLEVCGKKYIFTWGIDQLISAMQQEINKYGKRSNEGLGKGMDTKSLSHAVRVLYQLREIILTRDIKFPLKDADYIKSIKLGEVPIEEVMSKIDELYEECTELLRESDLPEEVDLYEMYQIIIDFYFN